ncbi:DUF3866 family protein [Phycicoccus sp. Root101]|uniref:DUF3866 family protein n=1 Tax=Phycicoccus sp. Root101 TaxID=1736421 RepID=UPI00070248EB|nr:DUF3866 family protein [Phycicoccus sp. Root101]KQU68664.1 hypothetical protein ASC58_08120 [Phycicoccus sp. Root101]
MMQWREGTVQQVRGRWPGAVEYAVQLAGDDGDVVRALAYTALVGEPQVGDRVLLNASALLRGLGTGGLAFVVAAPDRLPADPPASEGHIVKARYTPQQQMFMAVDEQDSPHHAALTTGPAAAGDLLGLPVVVADLHSALPAVLAGLRTERPDARVVYLMTDGGALPLAFSRAVAGLTEAGWLHGTVTVGQAYGGEHEAVTLHSGLLAARHVLGADVAVVIQGPGNVGTGTTWGYTGVAAGEALNAVGVLRGRGVAALRVSDADQRGRHRGISHHSRTAYGRVCLTAADVPVGIVDDEFGRLVLAQAGDLVDEATGDLTLREVPVDGLDAALRGTPVKLSTMGRGLDEDHAAFLHSAAAGRWAARLLSENADG